MNIDIDEALEIARTPKPVGCGECGEMMFSPMDKLSIALYGKCSVHLEENSPQESNLLKISEAL